MTFKDPEVPFYPIYGVGKNTEALLSYPDKCYGAKFFDCQPKIKYRPGDGTVLTESLSYGDHWKQTKLLNGY